MFPGLVALYSFIFESRGPTSREGSQSAPLARRIRHGLVCASPFMAETLIYLSVRKLILGNQALGTTSIITAVQFAATAPRVMAAYLELLAMPWLATPGHRVLLVSTLSAPAFWLPAIILASLAAAVFMLLIERRRRELYVFCAGWIVMSLAPVMYLPALRPDQIVADNYLYTASAGSSVLIADWIVHFSRRGTWSARLAWSAVAAMMLVCAVSLWRAQAVWHDNLSLFSRCVQDFPEAQICHSQLGTALKRSGDLAGAQRELRAAHELGPDPVTLFELGQVDAQLGQVDLGAQEVAAGLSSMSNRSAYGYMVLAQLYYLNGEQARSEAILKYMETLFDGAHAAGLARARIEVDRGDAAGAETLLRSLTARYPDDERSWAMLGQVLAGQGRVGEALSAYNEAAKVAPGDPGPWLAAAQLLHASNRDREALEQCRRALAAAPNNPDALALMTQIERGIAKR